MAGTPEIAVPALRALAETTELVGVVSQPDRPAGRGMSLKSPAVKQMAESLGIEVHQPVKVKTGNLHEWIAARRTEAVIVMAYGRILPRPVLDAPRLGCLNLHASVLPGLRGAAPINWAIIRGEQQSGISLMGMEEGLDTGPVYATRTLDILPEETAAELACRLAELAREVVLEDLPAALRGDLVAVEQDHERATFAPPITDAHWWIDWRRPTTEICNLVRGLAPRPGARTTLEGKCLRILALRPSELVSNVPSGTISVGGTHQPIVRTIDGAVEVVSAQVEGRRVCNGAHMVHGRLLRAGSVLGR
jgi:methionyl-tRNA formyltransferase